ncbi:uncharacterized protein [Musca autumnalis]|uniref:uncharacterized protein n=1 Tax=Musca autumnalis TaxID=221902 RepID=UPI003CF902A4
MYHYFLRPYRDKVWKLLLFSFVVGVLAITWVEYMKTGHMQWISNTLVAYCGLLYIPFRFDHIPPPQGYILEMIILVAGFSLSSCYLANLSSILLKKIYKSKISSIQDIIEHNMSILINKYDEFTFYHFGAPEAMKQQILLVSEELLFENRRRLNPQYIYPSMEDKTTFYLYQQKFLQRPILKVLDTEIILQIVAGIPMKSYWPLQDLLMAFTDNFHLSGLYRQIFDESLQDGILYGQIAFLPTEVRTVEPLNMEYFQFCITILIVGYIMSTLSFVLELIVFGENQRVKNVKNIKS